MKTTVLILSIILILTAATGILLQTLYRDDLRVQRLLARYSGASYERVLEAAASLRDEGTPESLAESIALYRETVSYDSQNPYRWCDLAGALLDSGDTGEARRCYERAAELGPNNIQTLWHVMQFYMHVEEYRDALRYGSHILQTAPDSSPSVFLAYLRSGIDFADTLSYGIPLNQTLAQAYLRYLIEWGDESKTEQCWNWVTEHSFADDRLAGAYLSFLIRIGEPEKARDTWAAYLGNRSDGYLQTNFLYNGGFESPPGPSPFDWKISNAPGAEAVRDSSFSREGTYSLRIRFDGNENPSYRQVSQQMFLEPGRYRFRGFVRAEGITTDKGIGFRAGSARTGQATGTCDWTELQMTLDIKESSLVRVEVVRDRSAKIDNKIGGSVWIDDLFLAAESR